MKIIVCIKQVPDTKGGVKFNPDGTLDRAAMLAIMNPDDNYKINDEEEIVQVEKLRENSSFNQKLQKMMAKLTNSRNKDSKNRKVLQILENAGKEIYDTLE